MQMKKKYKEAGQRWKQFDDELEWPRMVVDSAIPCNTPGVQYCLENSVPQFIP